MSQTYNVFFKCFDSPITIKSEIFNFGPISIRYYAVFIAFAFVLGSVYVFLRAKKFGIKNEDDIMSLLIYVTISSIVGARAYYVLFSKNNSYFKDPISIFRIYEGGLAIYGGIIAALVVGTFVCKFKKIKILPVLDLFSIPLLLGQAIGRWGNFFNQEAFGTPTDLPWGMKSENTKNIFVHPCFFYEFLWCFIGFFVLHFLSFKIKKKSGKLFFIYISWYGFGRFFIEFLRTDSLIIPGISWFKISSLVSFIFFIFGVFMLSLKRNKSGAL